MTAASMAGYSTGCIAFFDESELSSKIIFSIFLYATQLGSALSDKAC
jgi:hypothetical protein